MQDYELMHLEKELSENQLTLDRVIKKKDWFLQAILIDSSGDEILAKIVCNRFYFNCRDIRAFISNESRIASKLDSSSNGLLLSFKGLRYTSHFMILMYGNPNRGRLAPIILEKGLNNERLLVILSDILNGIENLRRIGVAHQGINLQSLFVHNSRVVLGGFEFCVDLNDPNQKENEFARKIFFEDFSDPFMIPPETLTLSQKPNTKTPLFSLGMIAYFLTTRSFPQKCKGNQREIAKYYASNRHSMELSFPFFHYDQRFKILVKDLLNVDVKSRPTVAETMEIVKIMQEEISKTNELRNRISFFDLKYSGPGFLKKSSTLSGVLAESEWFKRKETRISKDETFGINGKLTTGLIKSGTATNILFKRQETSSVNGSLISSQKTRNQSFYDSVDENPANPNEKQSDLEILSVRGFAKNQRKKTISISSVLRMNQAKNTMIQKMMSKRNKANPSGSLSVLDSMLKMKEAEGKKKAKISQRSEELRPVEVDMRGFKGGEIDLGSIRIGRKKQEKKKMKIKGKVESDEEKEEKLGFLPKQIQPRKKGRTMSLAFFPNSKEKGLRLAIKHENLGENNQEWDQSWKKTMILENSSRARNFLDSKRSFEAENQGEEVKILIENPPMNHSEETSLLNKSDAGSNEQFGTRKKTRLRSEQRGSVIQTSFLRRI